MIRYRDSQNVETKIQKDLEDIQYPMYATYSKCVWYMNPLIVK